MSRILLLSVLLLLPLSGLAIAEPGKGAPGPKVTKEEAPDPFSPDLFAGFKLRNIGPAFMSGRIAHIEFDPKDPNIWYVAAGSGGVWKTLNAGTTWTQLFDGQGSYSIGTLKLDPSNSSVLWVGTGEDVGGRHVGFGDGIYRSEDGGKNWKHMGLKKSEHIARILIHPKDSNKIYVAAQGPLWSKGGERGFFKSTDGGVTWKKTLGDEAYTGVTDIAFDPRNPDLIYAATWQRQRTAAAYMGGGPKSGIYRSHDGGETWTRLEQGLPKGNMGKIGLAVSSLEPDTLYAAIELDRRSGGIYRSTDRGATWEKRSDAVSGGTGPHYYQEIYLNPHKAGLLYLLSNTTRVSHDGGKSFEPLNNNTKHVDDHAVAFRADNPNYLLFGCDGGLYESFDNSKTWKFVANLPITQFYKVAVDDDKPFYKVYGGTQDNNSVGAPSRTDNVHGIRNSDWTVTLFADGHQSATEPGNPDIVYAEWQQGNLVRYDRTVGEIVHIKPLPEPNDPPERFNWDAPILVSPHAPKTLYFASQRVWRSENRGDSWTAISGDLTRNLDRLQMPLLDQSQGWDAPWDMGAMSQFGTITSLAESPLKQGLLYAGSDDGLIQVSENGGGSWRKIEVKSLPGAPEGAFINDIKADLFAEDTLYVALDNHKNGDFKPYLYKSTDRGKKWQSMTGNLPDRHLVWRLVQDHVKPGLFFVGTEFGIFFTVDGGERWIALKGDAPTIAFRDLAIQRRENDLVGASFGRGIFILDDYSGLRELTPELLKSPAALFSARPAHWYIERSPMGSAGKAEQGDAFFTAPNPEFGATFTYYLGEGLKSRKERRQEEEKKLLKEGKSLTFPKWEDVLAEEREPVPALILTIRDSEGKLVRRLENGARGKGFSRITWDLRYPAGAPISAAGEGGDEPKGHLAEPGSYSAELSKRVEGEVTALAGPVKFEVRRMTKGTLHKAEAGEVVTFWKRLEKAQSRYLAMVRNLALLRGRSKKMGEALARSKAAPMELSAEEAAIAKELEALEAELLGTEEAYTVGKLEPNGIGFYLSAASIGTAFSSYGPTPTHERSLNLAEEQLASAFKRAIELGEKRIPAFEKALIAAGAPYVPGMPLSLLE